MSTQQEILDSSQPSPLQLVAPAAALALVLAVVASGANAQTVWYVVRGTGVIAYLLLALTVMVGLLISGRAVSAGRPRIDLYEIHTFAALLALAFTSVHGLALLLDNFVSFSPAQILIPFTSSYRPFAVSLGIISGYLAAVVYASFWVRRYIGYKTWRTQHYGSFAALVFAIAHGLLSGTDTPAPWMLLVYVVSAGIVGGLATYRLLTPPTRPRRTG
ncbi:MAG: ferric reductase-like transmembrane domain-containing protein [Dehalococcoidia bacterium]